MWDQLILRSTQDDKFFQVEESEHKFYVQHYSGVQSVFNYVCRSSVLEPFGHQIAVMINEATAAIEL